MGRRKLLIIIAILLAAGGLWFVPQTPPAHPSPLPTSSDTSSPHRANLPVQSASIVTQNRTPTVSDTVPPAQITTDPETGDDIIVANGTRYPLRTYRTHLVPNDPAAQQWWANSTELYDAWQHGAGSYTPTIAIIDTGFALAHQEFANRWQYNTSEQGATTQEGASRLNCTDRSLPLNRSCNLIDDNYDSIVDNETGNTTTENQSQLNCTSRSLALDKSCNLIDDDNNGFIDDVTGWDFANYDHSVQAGQTNPTGDGTLHGTIVAGILGATGNNGVGIAGVNWFAKLLPLQALDDDGYGNTLTVARAVYYAADRNADVISISLGAEFEDPYLRQAIDYALAAGSIVVAASGNDGCNCISYPARYPEVLAVGAADQNGNPSTFSNFGSELDIIAPGEAMTAPAWSVGNPTAAYVSGAAGTSLATPYVSGLLALGKSHQPSANWAELSATLFEQSDRKSLSTSLPHSTSFGYGYAQAGNFMTRITTPATPGMRYFYGPVTPADSLDSARNHACETTLPASLLYEITFGSTVRYTTSKLALYQAQVAGWTKAREFPVCIGLPADIPAAARTINLLSEIKNLTGTKP